MKKKLKGVLFFWSETGTEGGDWAFQDERFITVNRNFFSCAKCFKYWDKGKYPDGPIDEPREGLRVTHMISLDKLLTGDPDALGSSRPPAECPSGKHDFKPTSKNLWSYEGSHVLRSGDHLTIYDKSDHKKIVWDGDINLTRFSVFTKHARGMWIHADQKGVRREIWAKWFMEDYPARLVLGKESLDHINKIKRAIAKEKRKALKNKSTKK